MGSALLETMTAQVTEECEGNRAAAQQEANAIKADAESESAAQRDTVQAGTDAEMERLDERWRQMAHAEASRADLMVKNDAVKAIMEKVQAEVRAIVAGGEFPGLLDALLTSLQSEINESVVVVGPESHVDHIKGWLASNGHAGVTVQGSAEMWDGVAVQDAERTYRISNTLSGRYGRVEQDARRLCMVKLFGNSSAEGAQ
ncbi:MAG: V-type ATP synthase subunit E family protein [Candidatus Hydrogenedentota bacterium]